MSMSPVLFLVFNRPQTTTRVFDEIRRARPPRLYVAADGPRAAREGEDERCAEVRLIATAVDWPCEVKTLFRDTNLGCRRAVSGAITWFFDHEREGIILEDDCLPHPSFFSYCAALLERYRDDPRIMCITGNNFQPEGRCYEADYYFSIYNHCWGWASWRRAWLTYDAELADFDPATAPAQLSELSDVRGFAAYWTARFRDVREGRVDSWANVWTWTCFKAGGLTCTPRVNLVSNIGFGPDATHTKGSASSLAELPRQPINLPLASPASQFANTICDKWVTQNVFGVGRKSLTQRLFDILVSLKKYNVFI